MLIVWIIVQKFGDCTLLDILLCFFSYAHQIYIYLIKQIKQYYCEILLHFKFKIAVVYLNIFEHFINSCDGKAEFPA